MAFVKIFMGDIILRLKTFILLLHTFEGFTSSFGHIKVSMFENTSVESCNKTLQSLRFTQVKSIVY
jgi:hypothetical protein